MAQITTKLTASSIGPLNPQECLKIYKDLSPQYLGLTQGFNTRFEANNCEVIYLPTNSNEVKSALTEILGNLEYKCSFSIKGGGHCYENFVYNDKILAIIDLSLMQQVSYVPHPNTEATYSVEAGGTNWTLLEQLYRKFGLVIPGGSCYSVGLGGHICGGGYGLLSRQFGLTIDYLCGVDIVCVNKDMQVEMKSIRADLADPINKDLLWATKGGGGGNFGIITCYYFHNLPKAPQSAYIETLSIEWKDLNNAKFFSLLELYWKLCHIEIPYFSILYLTHMTAGEIHLIFQIAFDDNYSLDYLVAFKKDLISKEIPYKKLTISTVGHPCTKGVLNLAHKLTWFEAAQTLNSSGSNQCGKHKSSYMRKPFPKTQSDKLFKFLTMNKCCLSDLAKNNPSPNIIPSIYLQLVEEVKTQGIIDLKLSLVQVDSYGVKINTIQSDATAIPQRDSLMKLQFQTYWKKAPVSEVGNVFNQFLEWVHRLWINEMFSEVYSDTGGVPDPYYVASETTHDADTPTGVPVSSCVNPTLLPPDSRIVDGCYYNYIDVDLIEAIKRKYPHVKNDEAKEAVLRLYFRENLDRLVSTKSQFDPNNIFVHKLSIPTKLIHNMPANIES